MKLLDKFQAEIGKRILKLPRSHTNISVLLGLKWPSFHVLILLHKLSFLAKLLSNNSSCISSNVFQSLAAIDPCSIGLVQQCKEMEVLFGTNFSDQCLNLPDDAIQIIQQAKPLLIEADWVRIIRMTLSHPSLKFVQDPKLVDDWCNLWNPALDFGTRGTKVAQVLFKILTRPIFGEKICPLCSSSITSEPTFFDHLATSHGLLREQILSLLSSNKPALFSSPIIGNIFQFAII